MPGRKGVGSVTLNLLVLKTQRVSEMRRFYCALGVELVEEKHGNGPIHYSGRIGDTLLEVYPLADNNTPADSTTRLGFAVEDLDHVVQAVRGAGSRVLAEPKLTTWGLRAVVCDPDDRAVELYQR